MSDSSPSIFIGKTAVVAEDEELLLELIVIELEEIGVQCFQAKDGLQALKHIQENHIDFLLSDVRMPGGSGVELLQELKKQKLLTDKPIIMMSGYTDLSIDQAQGLGALTIVSKPFKMSDIIPLIADSLRRIEPA